MNDIYIEKLKRFANDQQMMEAVLEVLEAKLGEKSEDRDVQNLAARFLAIEILRDVWKEIERFKQVETKKEEPSVNIGL